jgi:peptidoglycan-N-acetylglucosamine deacetylase
LVHSENVRGSLPTSDWTRLEARVERNVHELLDIVAGLEIHSTFFVLGWIARTYPTLVRRIAAEGHEIASHTDLHRRLNELPRDALLDDLSGRKQHSRPSPGHPSTACVLRRSPSVTP